jgi:hypothetical protein
LGKIVVRPRFFPSPILPPILPRGARSPPDRDLGDRRPAPRPGGRALAQRPPAGRLTPAAERLVTGGDRDPFLPRLLGALKQANEIDLAVAFVKPRGLDLLFPARSDAMELRGARLRVLISDYLDVTDPQALRQLLLLFNEGVDLPAIDTLMLLRTTESKILLLQQLGRDLRRHPDKERLVVRDFIGNRKAFLNKPDALFDCGKRSGDLAAFARRAGDDAIACTAMPSPANASGYNAERGTSRRGR